MEQNYPQQTVNLTVYGYKGPFVNKPVISIYYNDVLIGDVTQNEIRVFEVAVPGRLMFKYKHLTVYLPITSANGVQVDFDRFSGGLLMQQWLPTVHKENEVFNRKPQKEKKKFDFWGFVKKRKKEIIICLAALAVIIAMFFIADAINNAILTDKVQAYLDGKLFLTGEYVKGESADVYAFEDGCARHEDWMFDKVFESLDDPAVPYKADGSLFSNEVMLKYKNGKNWSYLVYVEICDDGSVDYLYGGWKEITMDEFNALKAAATCTHTFQEKVIAKATCTSEGEVVKTCTACGYEETQTFDSLGHVYKDKVCTRCGEEKPREKSDIKANTWYTYGGVLAFKNCEVISAGPMGNGMAVHYYPVCSSCHVAAEMSALAGPEPNYPISKIYTCRNCGEWTTVEMKVGNFGN